METIVILFMGLLILNAAVWHWGFDSRDGLGSAAELVSFSLENDMNFRSNEHYMS